MINRDKIKDIACNTIDITIDSTKVVVKHIPFMAGKIIQRSAPCVEKGVKLAAKTAIDTLYKIAFK